MVDRSVCLSVCLFSSDGWSLGQHLYFTLKRAHQFFFAFLLIKFCFLWDKFFRLSKLNKWIIFKAIFERSLDILHLLVYFFFKYTVKVKNSLFYIYVSYFHYVNTRKKIRAKEKKPLNRIQPGAREKMTSN
jgi:hypothetical protein